MTWRDCADLPPASLRFDSPYDPDARLGNLGNKRSAIWSGYRVVSHQDMQREPSTPAGPCRDDAGAGRGHDRAVAGDASGRRRRHQSCSANRRCPGEWRRPHRVAADLRLPAHAEGYQPRPQPFQNVGGATRQIIGLLPGLPRNADLAISFPETGERPTHCHAAITATLVASLELSRTGRRALQQDHPWAPIQVQHLV